MHIASKSSQRFENLVCLHHFSDTVLLIVISYLPDYICMATVCLDIYYFAAFNNTVHMIFFLEILSFFYFWEQCTFLVLLKAPPPCILHCLQDFFLSFAILTLDFYHAEVLRWVFSGSFPCKI